MAIIRGLIFFVLLCGQALAQPAVSIEADKPEGRLQNAFVHRDGKWIYVKNTNFFGDSSPRLGIFHVSNPKALEKPLARLKKLHAALEKVEKRLPPERAKNEESKNLLHATHYKLGKHVIDADHPYYKKVEQAFEALRFNAELKQESGVHINAKRRQLIKLKDGKKAETKTFNADFYCKSKSGGHVCEFDKIGLLFLPRP